MLNTLVVGLCCAKLAPAITSAKTQTAIRCIDCLIRSPCDRGQRRGCRRYMEQGHVRIGVSGWRYAPWRGEFYPKSLRQAEELSYLASQLSTVEINGTFYSLQSPASFAAWHAATPEGFVFAVKGSRYLTHILRLKEFERPLANFLASGLFNLGEKLGPLLWQFPPNLRFEPDRFETFMQERQVTIAGQSHKVPEPFLVMATQNPIESEGTYPLPEAQVDRFMSRRRSSCSRSRHSRLRSRGRR